MMAVALLPYDLPRGRFARLAGIPLVEVQWPLGEAAAGGSLGDLGPDDHLIVHFNSRSMMASQAGLRCRVSALLREPPAIAGRRYRLIRFLGRRYHRVLTHETGLLQALPNARFVAHGDCWVQPPHTQDHPKTGRIALIASKKADTAGHRLRHRIAEWSRQAAPDLALFGRAYAPLPEKAAGHSPFFFSVVIENGRSPGYFTEKLIDSLVCMSLPVYWGAPDIGHFFDPRGMVVCATGDDIKAAIAGLTPADWTARKPYLAENWRRAQAYLDGERLAAETLTGEDIGRR